MSEKIWILIFILFPPLAVMGTLVIVYYNNKFINPHPDRQWLAIRNVFTSRIDFIKEGVAYRMPWWRFDTDVFLNKEDMATPEGGHKANTRSGGEVIIEARYNELTGRAFDRANGQLTDGSDAISEEHVLWAITRTSFARRKEYVAEVFSASADYVIGLYGYDELMAPGEQSHPVFVPRQSLIEGIRGGFYNLPAQRIRSRGDLLLALATYIQQECNYRLRDVGFNVDEVQIDGLRPADPQVQEDLDRQQRLRSRRRAMQEVEGLDLTDREKMADIDDLPEIAKAEAQRRLAEAAAEGARAIADGLRNFGRGT